MQLALNHVTRYQYNRPVRLGPQLVRLRPAPHSRTRVLSYGLQVGPQPHELLWQQDAHGNHLACLVFAEPTDHLTITVDLVAEMVGHNPFDFLLAPHAQRLPFDYGLPLARELGPSLQAAPLTPRLADYLGGLEDLPADSLDFLVALNQRLCTDIRYLVRMEPGVQTPEQTLEKRSGSCRDSAWLMVQLLRHRGLAARFASGYLLQVQDDEQRAQGDGPAFNDLHAWCEVFLPGAGWVGLDPTSGLLAGETHVPLACTPTPAGAAPLEGSLEPCQVNFSHHMTVHKLAAGSLSPTPSLA